jgi:Peptidase family M28/PA domain
VAARSSSATEPLNFPLRTASKGTHVRGLALTVGLCAVLAAAAGCAGGERDAEAGARPTAVSPDALARAVTPAHLRAHLVALAAIARRNGGTRETGSSGYQQSAAYVARQLRAAGYRPRLQSFSFDRFRETRPPRFERTAPGTEQYRRGRDFLTLTYSGAGNVSAAVAPVEPESSSSGCERSDFAGFARGAVALLRRGGCFIFLKARNAAAAGAGAVLIANEGVPGRTAPIAATLVRPGIGIPVLGISSALGSELTRSAKVDRTPVRIIVSAVTRRAQAPNVIADLPGRESGVVLLGAHLDSVPNGPGINDNGSGAALVLEIARQARRLGVRQAKSLRFAFWGGEELGLVGSASYAASLGAGARNLRAVLNFDMVGSRNFGRFVYDGDREPAGSVQIEDAFRAYFGAHRQPVEEIALAGNSDHAPFEQAGVPVGGLFTGADELKTAREAGRFGGAAGRPYDTCYHRSCDTLANVNLRVLGQMADAAAVVAFRLAR